METTKNLNFKKWNKMTVEQRIFFLISCGVSPETAPVYAKYLKAKDIPSVWMDQIKKWTMSTEIDKEKI
jgi:hypothetical protein